MAPPRKSAKHHELTGAYANHPKRRRKDVEATGAIGPWRQWSTDPATVWNELVACCAPGTLTAADRPALETTVGLLVAMRKSPATFSAASRATLVNLLAKFGFTPASRLSMAVPDPKDSNDPAERYFSKP